MSYASAPSAPCHLLAITRTAVVSAGPRQASLDGTKRKSYTHQDSKPTRSTRRRYSHSNKDGGDKETSSDEDESTELDDEKERRNQVRSRRRLKVYVVKILKMRPLTMLVTMIMIVKITTVMKMIILLTYALLVTKVVRRRIIKERRALAKRRRQKKTKSISSPSCSLLKVVMD